MPFNWNILTTVLCRVSLKSWSGLGAMLCLAASAEWFRRIFCGGRWALLRVNSEIQTVLPGVTVPVFDASLYRLFDARFLPRFRKIEGGGFDDQCQATLWLDVGRWSTER